MFGVPERRTNTDGSYFFVPLVTPKGLGVRATLTVENKVEPDITFQSNFRSLQDSVLSDIMKNRQLFKNPPTLESLQAITPNWGCIVSNKELKWNSYMQIALPALTAEQLPAYVDFQLVGLSITRSTISPHFQIEFLECIKGEIIDFEWPSGVGRDELEEVSDIASTIDGNLTLRNPAQFLKEKLERKHLVRNAFINAEAARVQAEEMAKKFCSEFDLSDDESAFTEWTSDSDDSSVS